MWFQQPHNKIVSDLHVFFTNFVIFTIILVIFTIILVNFTIRLVIFTIILVNFTIILVISTIILVIFTIILVIFTNLLFPTEPYKQLINIQPTKGSAFRGTVPVETYQHTKTTHSHSGSSDDYQLPPMRKKRRVESKSQAALPKSGADVSDGDEKTSSYEKDKDAELVVSRRK